MSKKPVKQPYVAKAVVKAAAAAPVAAEPVAEMVAEKVAPAPAAVPEVVLAAPVAPVAAPVVAPVAAPVAIVETPAPEAIKLPEVIVEALSNTATKTIAETRTAVEKVQASTSEINGAVESGVNVFSKGLTELNAKILNAVRSNSDAVFELFMASFAAKTPSELMTLQVEHARKQLETFGVQAKDFSAAATKIATDATQPLKAKVEKILAI